MSENRIKTSIENIEPDADAKERMYANILKKAEMQRKTETEPVKTKINPARILKIALPAAACLAIIITGGVSLHLKNQDNVLRDNLPGVWEGESQTSVEGSEAFSKLGIDLEAPKEAAEKSYYLIGEEIASIQFLMNGKYYEIRASLTEGDISGIFGTAKKSETIDAATGAVLDTIDIDYMTYYRITWKNGSTNYCLYNSIAADKDEVIAVYKAISY